jgi:hypothetical protein
MTGRARALTTAVPVLLAVTTPLARPATAQAPVDRTFLDEVDRTAEQFAHVDAAVAAGYRKLGPDFPGMGEHWIHPSRVISGIIDPKRPPVLAYTRVGAERVLVGVAFTRVLGPDEQVPAGPFPPAAWHDHTGGVDEESLLLSGPASMHASGDGFRLAMVHVWRPLENPDEVFAQNNWRLPFARASLRVGSDRKIPSEAARGLSLAGVGAGFYDQLLRDGIGLDESSLETARQAFRAGGWKAESWLQKHRDDDPIEAAALAELQAIWVSVWTELEATLPGDSYARIAMLGPASAH